MVLVLCFALSAASAVRGQRDFKVLSYDEQLIDHSSPLAYPDAKAGNGTVYSQRYFESDMHFGGPGYPIFVVIGGEGGMDPDFGIVYPWVQYVVARRFKALVVQPEHRFYGVSMPVPKIEGSGWERLLTPMQSLADLARFANFVRAQKCEPARDCPIITFGGSYPGWLSAMARMRYPAVFAGAYAGSAPMKFYGQTVAEGDYYRVITRSAETAVPGCAAAARQAFADLKTLVFADAAAAGPRAAGSTVAKAADVLGLCTPLPEYLATDRQIFFDEISMVFQYTFANLNMAYYPPSKERGLAQACATLVAARGDAGRLAALRDILAANLRGTELRRSPGYKALRGLPTNCTSLQAQLPAGAGGSITCGDWSGCGTGSDGQSWDFQTSTLLVERIGTLGGDNDMFPARRWTLEWIERHAEKRFPGCLSCTRPKELVDLWGFGDAESLKRTGTSRIIFTNGLVDGWSAGGFLSSPDEDRDLITMNFPNGAHHSDLSHRMPDPTSDTPDITEGRERAVSILARWLEGGGRENTLWI